MQSIRVEPANADMQLLMTAAATLTGPQIRYARVIADDAISFSEL